MNYICAETGEVRTAYLFVATLPYSQVCYVEATDDMKEKAWLTCHVNMFQFFGGVPVKIVCDNLKTGVTSHPKQGEVEKGFKHATGAWGRELPSICKDTFDATNKLFDDYYASKEN